jgi:hypothetical protein
MVMTRVLFAVAAVAALAATAHAQVDCSNPDNLCTGDPCVIPPIEVQVPCVVDFGTRTVEIPDMLRVPAAPEPNNDVSFSAGRRFAAASGSEGRGSPTCRAR